VYALHCLSVLLSAIAELLKEDGQHQASSTRSKWKDLMLHHRCDAGCHAICCVGGWGRHWLSHRHRARRLLVHRASHATSHATSYAARPHSRICHPLLRGWREGNHGSALGNVR
jgi:hypothetical protein